MAVSFLIIDRPPNSCPPIVVPEHRCAQYRAGFDPLVNAPTCRAAEGQSATRGRRGHSKLPALATRQREPRSKPMPHPITRSCSPYLGEFRLGFVIGPHKAQSHDQTSGEVFM